MNDNPNVVLNRILMNINHLIHIQGLKKADVEKAAGVSPGYLSRFTRKTSCGSLPSLQFITDVASQLGVSIDDLVHRDLTNVSPDILKPIATLEKLFSETKNGQLSWEAIGKNEIRLGLINNSVVRDKDFTSNFEIDPHSVSSGLSIFDAAIIFDPITGIANDQYSFFLSGPVYIANFPSEAKFAIIPLMRINHDSHEKDNIYSLYWYRDGYVGELFMVCTDLPSHISERFKALIELIEKKVKEVTLVKEPEVLDAYLRGISLDLAYAGTVNDENEAEGS